jgi:hypothetical protein
MVAPLVALAPIVTAIGRFAVPYLAKELGKVGTNKFVQTYGNEAFTSLNETLTKNTTMVNPEAMPMVNPNFMSKKDEEDKTPTVVSEDKTKQPQKQPPEGPDLGTELATEAALQVSKKLSESEQTEKALKPKVEFGPLTETEKQTAKALKEGKSDFYSRAVESIKNAKQNKFTKGKWKSIVQSNSTKDEMDYLGLTEYLKGNESITKEELLKFVEKKDIAPFIKVRSIPKDEMNKMYETYSLGGYTAADTQEHIVFQFRPYKEIKNPYLREPEKQKSKMKLVEYDTPLFKSEHFDTEYGTNTFAHARTQVGFDPLEEEMTRYQDLNNEEIEKTFRNTLIVDEIQSDWLQKGQDKGFFSDFDVVANKDLKEYLDKNNIKYTIYNQSMPIEREFESEDSPLMLNEENIIELKSTTPGSTSRRIPLNVDNRFELFEKEGKHAESVLNVDNIKQAKNYFLRTGMYGVPDFPIKESKKFVELVLNKMIEKAVIDGRDSIAITNGQIQANRYDAMGEEEKEGLKKFYDEIVLKQLEKIADKYNVKLERVDISEGEAPKELQDIHLDNQIKRAQDDGYVLKKVDLQFLFDRTKDTNIPGHAALYSDRGAGQGANYIEDYLNELVDNRPFSPATGTGSGLARWNEIRNDKVYIWIKEIDIDDELISWELPIVPVKDAHSAMENITEIQQRLETLPVNTFNLEVYTQYIKNAKPPKSEEINPEQLIKMKLPKKLQKEILSKPIKLTKAKKQTDRLFA